mgnify:CR=1 FL=1
MTAPAVLSKGCPVMPGQRAASDAGRRKAEGRPHTGCTRTFRQRGEVPWLTGHHGTASVATGRSGSRVGVSDTGSPRRSQS